MLVACGGTRRDTDEQRRELGDGDAVPATSTSEPAGRSARRPDKLHESRPARAYSGVEPGMRMRQLSSHIRSSLWFIPVVCVLAGAVLSFGTIWLDSAFDYKLVPEGLSGGPGVALAILSTVRLDGVAGRSGSHHHDGRRTARDGAVLTRIVQTILLATSPARLRSASSLRPSSTRLRCARSTWR